MPHGRILLLAALLLVAPLPGASRSASPRAPRSPTPPARVLTAPDPPALDTGEKQRFKVRPAVRFERVGAESTLWAPDDSLATLSVRVTGAGGAPLVAGSGAPVLLPVLFTIESTPEGSAGHRLSSGLANDPVSVTALTSGSGHASATLHRGSGAGSYRVTASLPAEFASAASGVQPSIVFRVLTSGVPVELVSLSLAPNHVADGSDSTDVSVTALDVLGAPVSNAPLHATLRLVDDPLGVPMRSLGGGAFSGRVASRHPGLRGVEVWDPRTGVAAADTVRFAELPGATVELSGEGEMRAAGSARSLDLVAAVTDTFGNLLPAASHPVTFSTNLGTVTPGAADSARPWAHIATLQSTALGTARVIATHAASGAKDTLDAMLAALSLGREHHAVLTAAGNETPTRFTLPLSLYVPPPFTLGSGQLQIQFPPALASFAGFEDGDPLDPYTAQAFPGAPGTVQVMVPPPHGPPQGGLIELGLCSFDCEAPGLTSFTIVNASFTAATPAPSPLQVAPAENASVLQKDYTCRICFNFIYSAGCGEDFEKKMEKALEELQKQLNDACCTIQIDKPTFCKVKNLGNAKESHYAGEADGGRQSQLSGPNQKMIEDNKDCRKKECINVYVPIAIDSEAGTGGMSAPTEQGEADVPNHFDGAGNKKSGSITDSKGKPISGKSDKDLSSIFFQCKPNGGATPFDQQKMSHLLTHEFGHMMGLGHYKKKPGEKDKDAKKNAMAEGGLGTGFTAEQCELMMQDINGFCLEVLK